LTFQPKTMSFVGYPKVIPYTKFEHFRIIRFWVMLQTLVLTLTFQVTLTYQPKTIPLAGYPKVISYIKLEHFRIIQFWVMLRT